MGGFAGRFGFCGGAYASQSPLVDAQMSINFYPEKTENPNSRTPWALYRTYGLGLFCTLPTDANDTGITKAVRGSYTINGRTFKVYGTHLFELGSGGTFTDYGGNHAITGGAANNNLVDDGLPVTMVAGGTASGQYPGQLLIASGTHLTAFNLATNAFVAITSAPTNVVMIDYVDGFFVALQSINDFQVSAVEDCTNWPGLSISQVSVYSDTLLSIIENNRFLWVFGAKRAVAYDTPDGGAIFPFGVVQSSFIEMGIVAQFSPARVGFAGGTSIAWLAGDERGEAQVVAANGFIPQRVSDHALEYWLAQQNTISDAVGFATRENGHNFYTLWFPSANKTWTLDTDLGIWHQRSSLVNGLPAAHLGRCHTYNFGTHLVGDRTSGNIYTMSGKTYTDNGMPIVRTRIGPTVSQETNWVFVDEFQVDFETGLGPIPPLTDANGNPRAPQAMFSYSRDFGKTFGNERMVSCGQAGQYLVRATDRRLGKWRAFTPKVTVSDPIAWSISDAYINPTREPKERLAKTFGKIT